MRWSLPQLPAGQWVARAAIALLPAVALLCLAGSGTAAPVWLVAVVLLAGLAWAVIPESAAGAGVLAVVVLVWGIRMGDDLDPFVLPAAAALLAAHVTAVLASYGPATMPLDGAVVRLWVRRAALIYLPVPAVYLLASWAEDTTGPRSIWLAGAAATFLAISVAAVALSAQASRDG